MTGSLGGCRIASRLDESQKRKAWLWLPSSKFSLGIRLRSSSSLARCSCRWTARSRIHAVAVGLSRIEYGPSGSVSLKGDGSVERSGSICRPGGGGGVRCRRRWPGAGIRRWRAPIPAGRPWPGRGPVLAAGSGRVGPGSWRPGARAGRRGRGRRSCGQRRLRRRRGSRRGRRRRRRAGTAAALCRRSGVPRRSGRRRLSRRSHSRPSGMARTSGWPAGPRAANAWCQAARWSGAWWLGSGPIGSSGWS